MSWKEVDEDSCFICFICIYRQEITWVVLLYKNERDYESIANKYSHCNQPKINPERCSLPEKPIKIATCVKSYASVTMHKALTISAPKWPEIFILTTTWFGPILSNYARLFVNSNISSISLKLHKTLDSICCKAILHMRKQEQRIYELWRAECRPTA